MAGDERIKAEHKAKAVVALCDLRRRAHEHARSEWCVSVLHARVINQNLPTKAARSAANKALHAAGMNERKALYDAFMVKHTPAVVADAAASMTLRSTLAQAKAFDDAYRREAAAVEADAALTKARRMTPA